MGKFTLVTQKKKGSYLVQKVISVGKRKKATRRKQHQYMLHVAVCKKHARKQLTWNSIDFAQTSGP